MDNTEHDALRRAAVDMGPASLARAAMDAADRLEVESLAYRLAAAYVDLVNGKNIGQSLAQLVGDQVDARIAELGVFASRISIAVDQVNRLRSTAEAARAIGDGYKRSGG